MKMNTCSQCNKEVSADSPGGLCPVCVLKMASESNAETGIPPVSEIQAAFPQFKIRDCIGRGGMGIVYRAEEVDGGRAVALKVLDPSFNNEADFAERFERESRTLGGLKHPNIVSIYDFGKSEEFFWLTMELVDGVNLRQAMQTEKFSPKQALEIIPALCSALQYAHENGIFHRDVKPENILLGTSGVVKVADFGIARMVGDKAEFTLTRTGSAMGTTAYLAPEQIESPGDVDHRADIYSLGVVFYEMLTGSLPLGRFPAPSAKSESHPDLDEVVFRALEKERELRFQHAGDFSSGLRGMSGKVKVSDEGHRVTPEVFAGITLFGAVLAIAGGFVSPLLLGTGVALWVTGMALCWYALRTDTTMQKGQRKLLKWVSVGVPVGLTAVLGVMMVVMLLSYNSKKDEAFSTAMAAEEKVRRVQLIAEANEVLEEVLSAGQAGDVEQLKEFFSDDLVREFSQDADFGELLKIEWAKIEANGITALNNSASPPLASVNIKRGREVLRFNMSYEDEGWKVSAIAPSLLRDLSLSLEDTITVVEQAALLGNKEIFELYVMPDFLTIMKGKDGDVGEAMEELSKMDLLSLEVHLLESNRLAVLNDPQKSRMRIYFRFDENRWKLDLPEDEEIVTESVTEKSQSEASAIVEARDVVVSVESAENTLAAILDVASKGNEREFRRYLLPDFIDLVEKSDGSLKKLMTELAKLKSTGVTLSGVKDVFEEIRFQSIQTDYEVFLRLHGERWMLGAAMKKNRTTTRELFDSVSEAGESHEPHDHSEEEAISVDGEGHQ
ncbi:MAG: protein kinase domain-containing protein [Luteolibacter sp.]